MNIDTFLLDRIAEDEEAARVCGETFPAPWTVLDRGASVRIYASEVPDVGDHAEPGWTRVPVVMEVEPDRQIADPLWLSERVEHVRRHDPARVLAECQAKRRLVESYAAAEDCAEDEEWTTGYADGLHEAITILAQPYANHPDFAPAWRLP